MYYSAAWQVLEEEVDDSWSSGHSTDRLVQNVWGMRYIDDLAIRRQDTDYSGTWGNTSSGDFTHYALSDHQFSVVALIDDTAALVERTSYSPYGEARHHWVADVDGDGDVDATDRGLLNTSYNQQLHQTNYNVHADFNRDGVVDSNDIPLVSPTNYVAALSPGLVSSVGNVVGYAGYIFNDEISLYTVRFRCYDPATGRWLERDPAGYVDSMSLYGYGWGSPVLGNDPFGLDLLDDASNFFAGVGDALSFGITGMIRRGLGYDDAVDYNSTDRVGNHTVTRISKDEIDFIKGEDKQTLVIREERKGGIVKKDLAHLRWPVGVSPRLSSQRWRAAMRCLRRKSRNSSGQ